MKINFNLKLYGQQYEINSSVSELYPIETLCKEIWKSVK